MSALWAIASHDVRSELRRPTALGGVLLFGAGSLVALHLALAGGGSPPPGVSAGALWIVLLYGALLGVGRALAVEREEGTWDALLAAPADRSAVFVGKALAAAVQIVALHLVLVPLYAVLFGAPESRSGSLELAVAVLLADLGFAIVGVLLGALALRARGRELLGAALFLPLALPVVIVAVTLSLHAYGEAPDAHVGRLLTFLAAYDVTFLAVGIAAFPEVAVD